MSALLYGDNICGAAGLNPQNFNNNNRDIIIWGDFVSES